MWSIIPTFVPPLYFPVFITRNAYGEIPITSHNYDMTSFALCKAKIPSILVILWFTPCDNRNLAGQLELCSCHICGRSPPTPIHNPEAGSNVWPTAWPCPPAPPPRSSRDNWQIQILSVSLSSWENLRLLSKHTGGSCSGILFPLLQTMKTRSAVMICSWGMFLQLIGGYTRHYQGLWSTAAFREHRYCNPQAA